MNVICNAAGYTVKENADSYVVSNGVFASNLILLFFASICEMFLPDSTTYKAPVSVIIKKDGSENEVTVDKHLKIIGTNNYEYAISNLQLYKWFRSYFVMWIITALLMAVLAGFILFMVLPETHTPIVIICFLVVLGILAVNCINMGKQIMMIKTLKRID